MRRIAIITTLLSAITLSFAGLSPAQPPAPAPGPVPAQGPAPSVDQSNRPASAGRVVRFFDFEEHADPGRPDFDPDPVPRLWVRAQSNPADGRERPGFPQANEAGYDTSETPVAASGKCSVRLPTTGGSTSLWTRKPEGLIPVFAGADYAISALVRTNGLVHARAVLAARYFDQSGRPIEGSTRSSTPVISPDNWTAVSIELPGRFPGAAFIQIELLLLQPEQFSPPPSNPKHHVWQQDFSGTAWFDDIAVTQVARVELAPLRDSHVFIAPEAPTLVATIRDLTGESMTAQLELRDAEGRIVATENKRLVSGGGRFEWKPVVKQFGWYEAHMQVVAGGAPISRSHTTLLYLPAQPKNATAGSDLGLVASEISPQGVESFPGLVRALSVKDVSIPLWTKGRSVGANAASDETFRTMLDTLLRDGRRVTLSIDQVDPGLASTLRMDPSDPMGLLEHPATAWAPALRPLLDSYGQRITRYRIGSTDWPDSLTNPNLASRLALLRSTLAMLVPAPSVAVPYKLQWRAPGSNTALTPKGPDELLLYAPGAPSVADTQAWIDEVMQARTPGTPTLRIAIPSPKSDGSPQSEDVNRLFRETVLLWNAFNTRGPQEAVGIDLLDGWTADETGELRPDPSLALWSTLARHLSGRRVVAVLPAPPGVRCFLLGSPAGEASDGAPRRGALVLWSDSAVSSATLDGYFGLEPLVRIDRFGNSEPLKAADASGLYRINVTSAPVFIEGVSPELALFSLGFRVDPSFVPAVAADHEHGLIVTNPFPTPITGTVQFLQPGSNNPNRQWTFTPSGPMPFSIPAGASVRMPFSFSFGLAQDSGPVLLPMQVQLNADRSYPPMLIRSPLLIALPGLEMVAKASRFPDADGADVMVITTVTNTGTVNRSLELSAKAYGVAQQAQTISNLGPGQRIVRKFLFRDAGAMLSGKAVHITLQDAETIARLNSSPMVP